MHEAVGSITSKQGVGNKKKKNANRKQRTAQRDIKTLTAKGKELGLRGTFYWWQRSECQKL